MAFDPYSDLLGIPPGPRPPSSEQLLGVEPGESDEQAILAAAWRQNDRLKAYTLREWAEVATRLQREVGAAVVELTKRATEAVETVTLSPPSPQPPLATPKVAEIIAVAPGLAEQGTPAPRAAAGLPDARPAPRPKPPVRIPEAARPLPASDLPSGEKRLPSGSTLADLRKSAGPLRDRTPRQQAVVGGITTQRHPTAGRMSVRPLLVRLGMPIAGIFLAVVVILSLSNLRSSEVLPPKSPSKTKEKAPVVPAPPTVNAGKEAARSVPEATTKVAEEPQKGPLDRGPVVQMPPLTDPRPAVPSEADQRIATASLQRDYEEVFKIRFSENDREYRARLPGDLYRLASSPKIGTLGRFVLLDRAGQQAALNGDAALALQAAADLTQQFRADPMKFRLQFIELLASGYRGRNYFSQREREYYRKRAEAAAWPLVHLAEEAMGKREYATAQRVCKSAVDLGCESWDETVRQRFAAVSASVQRAFAEQDAFLEALVAVKQNADDPDSSWVAGRHLCLVLNKWDEGLPYLAHVSDENIRGAALLELDAASKKPEQQIVVAEKWWRAAQSREGMEQKGMLLRAADWYGRARAGLENGPLRGKIDPSLQEVLQELARLAAIPPGEPMTRVGYWNPEFIAQEPKTLRWDITPLVTLPGKYAVWFQCDNQADPLYFEWVALGKNGSEISRQDDRAVAASGRAWAQYTIELQTPEFGTQYGLYARVVGGTASSGCVWLKYLGLQADAAARP